MMKAHRWLLAAVLCCGLVITACGGPASHLAAAPRPPVVPGQITAGPDLTGVQLPNFIMPLISGGISLPKRQLTPGAVTTTNTTTVCNLPSRVRPPSISYTLQAAVYNSYGYTGALSKKYILDLLVPLSLGGAEVQANIWPAAIRGTGFFQKNQLDHILKDMVCRRLVTLSQAQHALESDWYAAWLKYVVATGHI
ncbi:MAG TPA: hypothetical protein VN840_16570 [Streptosporangiaceae bacterium]|nr:hypothetical protein [Streptosporangiaceae bacterium]